MRIDYIKDISTLCKISLLFHVFQIIHNPPFGGAEDAAIKQNFPGEFQTSETADLFMALIMNLLKDHGRCGVVLPDGFMFGDGVKATIKEKLLKEYGLHTIIRLP